MRQAWWESRWFACALILLSVVPLLYPPFPPLVDLPSHMGRYKIAMGDSALLARFFEFRWQLSGNLGADLLIVPLSWIVGPVAATKFIVTLIPPLTVGAVLAVSKTVLGRHSPTAALAVPLTYTQPFLYGFLNYVLAVALALWIFCLFLRLGRAGRLKVRAALMVPLGFALFITHVSGWGILGLIAFASEWVRLRAEGHGPGKAIGLAAVQMVPLVLPLFLLLLWQSGASGTTWGWLDWRRKLRWSMMLFRDGWPAVDKLTSVALFALAIAILLVNSFRIDRLLGFSALALLGAFLALPFILFGSALGDIRIVPVMLMLLFAGVRATADKDQRPAMILASAVAAFVVLRVAAVTVSFAHAADRQKEQLAVLDRVERGSRIAVAVGDKCSDWKLPRSDHLGSMAIVRREAFVNDQWYLPGSVSLIVRNPEAGAYATDPSQLLPYGRCGPEVLDQWMERLPASAFDHVWLLETEAMPKRFAGEWRLVAERPGSRLYARQAGRVSTQP